MLTLKELIDYLQKYQEIHLYSAIYNPKIKNNQVVFEVKENIYVEDIINQMQELINDINYNFPVYIGMYDSSLEPLTTEDVRWMVSNNPKSLSNVFTAKIAQLAASLPDYSECKKDFWCFIGLHRIINKTVQSYSVQTYSKINLSCYVPSSMTTIYCDKCGNHQKGLFWRFLKNA